MASIYETLQGSIKDFLTNDITSKKYMGGIMNKPPAQTVTADAVDIISLESGGNPYAVNDNTTGQSYSFKTLDEASQYVNSNSSHSMAIGLFQLLTHGGMGDVHNSDPATLLDPAVQFDIAIPQIIKNDSVFSMIPPQTQAEQLKRATGNDWMADVVVEGTNNTITKDSLQKAVDRLNKGLGDTNKALGNDSISGIYDPNAQVKDAVKSFFDWKTIFNTTTYLTVGAIIAIFIIIANIAKGGSEG